MNYACQQDDTIVETRTLTHQPANVHPIIHPATKSSSQNTAAAVYDDEEEAEAERVGQATGEKVYEAKL